MRVNSGERTDGSEENRGTDLDGKDFDMLALIKAHNIGVQCADER